MKKKRLFEKERKTFLLRLPTKTFTGLTNLAHRNNSSVNCQLFDLIESELIKEDKSEMQKGGHFELR